jgi:hypothetical protein
MESKSEIQPGYRLTLKYTRSSIIITDIRIWFPTLEKQTGSVVGIITSSKHPGTSLRKLQDIRFPTGGTP